MSVVTLASIAGALAAADQLVSAPRDDAALVAVTGLSSDSRAVRAGHIFACKGVAFRADYLVRAAAAGAVAYLADAARAAELAGVVAGLPVLVVRDVRVAMAVAAPPAWGNPERSLRICGVTGTKGKSTVTYLLRAMLDAEQGSGSTALVGSIETYDGTERVASVNTTPEAPDLWRHLAHARASGLHDVVMEVSSQALKYHRVDGLTFGVAAFTNLGRDHISPVEHPTLEDYVASKLRIFGQTDVAVINAATDRAAEVLACGRARCKRVVTFSADPRVAAEVYASGSVPAAGGGTRPVTPAAGEGVGAALAVGTSFVAHAPTWSAPMSVPLPGAFNVENALAAIALADELGVSPRSIAAGLAGARVPGRMEVMADAASRGVVGVVDYAHNAMALSRFFPAVRDAWPRSTLIAVFGATGGKGVERRREMPAEAARWADRLVFTEDDPGDEPVAGICAAMVEAVGGRVPTEVVPDRAAAVSRAVDLAFSCGGPAVVCVLGRGTEPTMHRGDALVAFPLDATLLRDALRAHL